MHNMLISPAVNKAFVLLSCTFLGLICGTLYLYSSYSPQFAKQLKYSVTDSSFIALLGTLGVAVTGPSAGAVVDKSGYTPALVIGGCEIILGYIAMKAQYDNEYSSVWLSACLIFAIGSGSTFINSACLKCCAVNFPSIRGVATSLPLALYGLSAMFYSVLASIFYPGDTSGFLGFLAYSSIAIFVICTPFVMMCDLYQSPRKVVRHTPEVLELNRLAVPASPRAPARSSGYEQIQKSLHAHERSGIALITSYEFWLLFIVTGTLASLGQMYIYSVGYMVKALITRQVMQNGVDPTTSSFSDIESIIQKDQQFQVGLLSIANCVGRIVSGIMGDIISQSFNKSRTWLLFLPCFGLMITQIMGYQVDQYSGLSLDSLLTGFFYGFTFCIMPIIVGDTFGMDNFSSNWGIVGLAPIIPSFYFTSLFGKIYDSNSQYLEDPLETSKELVCLVGNHCYNSIFKITFFITFLALICAMQLNFKFLLGSWIDHSAPVASIEYSTRSPITKKGLSDEHIS